VDKQDLKDWLSRVSLTNTTYFRARRELFAELTDAFSNTPDQLSNPIEISREKFQAIKSYLTARNDKLDDNKTLAFDSAINELDDLVETTGDIAAPTPVNVSPVNQPSP